MKFSLRAGKGGLASGIFVALGMLAGSSDAQPAVEVVSYLVPGNCPVVWKVVPGPDDAIWFTMTSRDDPACTTPLRQDSIGRLSTDGVITEFPLPPTNLKFGRGLHGLTIGPDDALWFTEIRSNKIGRITTAGEIARYSLPPGNTDPYEITSGPDGALWFTENHAIGRITTSRVVTRYPVESPYSTDPLAIVTGSDGALWFTEINNNSIGRITTQGALTRFPLSLSCAPHGIAAGPDGAVWFACLTGNVIGRMTVDGILSTYALPTADSRPVDITLGPDGALWFTEQNTRQIGRITTDGIITEYSSGLGTGVPITITARSDGIWFGKGNYIGHIPLADSEPPVIAGMPESDCSLWPPNHKLFQVATIVASDAQSGLVPGSFLATVTSSEPVGPFLPDFVVSPDGPNRFVVELRAERRSGRADRVYTIRATATDRAGNVATETATCTVPSSQ